MLIGVDIIGIEKIIINFVYRSLTVGNVFSFRTNIYIHAKDNVKIRRIIKIVKDVVIPPHSVIKIFIKIKKDNESLTNNRNYLFKSDRSGGYYHLINTDPIPPYKNYARYYVDDIIIFSKTFE